jgi:hypothetical protein
MINPITEGLGNARNHPLNARWKGMKQRCFNPNKKSYKDYGGRGIKMCQRWRENFWAFVEDMGMPQSADLEIDRIDNNGDYSPENCRWADKETQLSNKRSNRWLKLNEKKLTLSQWAKLTGLNKRTITDRIESGWSVKKALTTPRIASSGISLLNKQRLGLDGECKTMTEWSCKLGFPKRTIGNRLCKGWSVEKTLTTPLILRCSHKKKALVKISACGT